MKTLPETAHGPDGLPWTATDLARFRRIAFEAEVETVMMEVRDELTRASELHGPFHSRHHGYAVLLEEVDELWHEIKHGTKERAREEAIQVAAMALRYLIDIK